jgi:hypothetical protein
VELWLLLVRHHNAVSMNTAAQETVAITIGRPFIIARSTRCGYMLYINVVRGRRYMYNLRGLGFKLEGQMGLGRSLPTWVIAVRG